MLAKRCGDDAQRSLLVPEVDDSVDEFWLGECDLGEQSDRVVVVGDLMADGIGERVDGDCQPVSPRSFAARGRGGQCVLDDLESVERGVVTRAGGGPAVELVVVHRVGGAWGIHGGGFGVRSDAAGAGVDGGEA